MNMSESSDYHYEMVVNIVAEMVVEYLKTADRENPRTVTFDSKESNQSGENQVERAAA